ncbi:MAG: sulfotransferase family protein [Mycobacterium sp.]
MTNSPRDATTRPVALFVLGLGRSGTSALTRVLSLSGAALPPGLLGAIAGNPRGCWEPRVAVHLNEVILRRHGSSGYDLTLRMQEEGAFDAEEYAACVAKIRAFLTTLPAVPVVVIKEPKMTALSGMWFEAARLAGFDVATVIAVRHPDEAVGSLVKRANRQNYVHVSPELGSAWWLKYTLLAERATRGVPRVFVEYANLLEDWRREVQRISAALAIDLNAPDENAIDEFLTPELQHHRHDGPVAEPFGGDWISAVYQALRAAARDEPWDESELDRVFDAYRASERGFRTAFEDFGRYRKLNRLVLPSMLKVSLEVLAIAHRRKGTWA